MLRGPRLETSQQGRQHRACKQIPISMSSTLRGYRPICSCSCSALALALAQCCAAVPQYAVPAVRSRLRRSTRRRDPVLRVLRLNIIWHYNKNNHYKLNIVSMYCCMILYFVVWKKKKAKKTCFVESECRQRQRSIDTIAKFNNTVQLPAVYCGTAYTAAYGAQCRGCRRAYCGTALH